MHFRTTSSDHSTEKYILCTDGHNPEYHLDETNEEHKGAENLD